MANMSGEEVMQPIFALAKAKETDNAIEHYIALKDEVDDVERRLRDGDPLVYTRLHVLKSYVRQLEKELDEAPPGEWVPECVHHYIEKFWDDVWRSDGHRELLKKKLDRRLSSGYLEKLRGKRPEKIFQSFKSLRDYAHNYRELAGDTGEAEEYVQQAREVFGKFRNEFSHLKYLKLQW